jgi:acyl-CoA thioester hydrolase
MAEAFVHTMRPRFSECDRQGIVFNGHYLDYFDCNITELWRAAFGSYQSVVDRGLDIVLAEVHMRYLAPARFDELLELTVAVSQLGTTSMHTRHRVLRDGVVLVEGQLRHVMIGSTSLAKTEIPNWMRDGLARWTVSEPTQPR